LTPTSSSSCILVYVLGFCSKTLPTIDTGSGCTRRTTGVNGSPTKSTRSLQTVAALKDGEVIVLGGLIQDQDSETHSGQRWLPSFLHGHTRSKGRTEVVLVLQVQKV